MSQASTIDGESITIREPGNSRGPCAVSKCSRGSGIQKCREGFTDSIFVTSKRVGHLTNQKRRYLVISNSPQIVEIECAEVRRLLVEYMERDCSPEMRARIDHHLQDCRHCTAIYDGAHNVVRLVGDEKTIALPMGFSQRLHERLRLGTQ